jgi:hypothetical protein
MPAPWGAWPALHRPLDVVAVTLTGSANRHEAGLRQKVPQVIVSLRAVTVRAHNCA